jgi:sulfatase modifying factor 1
VDVDSNLVGNTYPWGNTIGGGDANYFASGDPFEPGGSPDTAPVGFYDGGQVPAGANRANGYGLYDMAGNLWEWCWDWHDNDYYGVSPTTDPHGPSSSPSGARVLRGGSWVDASTVLRCAVRFTFFPVVEFDVLGFRSARGL